MKAQDRAIKNLQENSNIVTKHPTRGEMWMLWTKTDMYKCAVIFLTTKVGIEKYFHCPFNRFIRFFTGILIDEARNNKIITEEQSKFLRVEHRKLPTFYCLPKTHKSLTDPKRRPLVSGIDSVSEQASIFVNAFLCPLVVSLPSYTKDSIDFIQQKDNLTIPSNSLLVTIEIVALYNCIPHDRGVQQVKRFLSQHSIILWPLN